MAYLLIIDDDEDFARAMAKVLSDAGHEVGISLDTQTAMASMKARTPDLVILDVMFPEDSSAGFGFARMMEHHNAAFKGIPILMLTAVNARFPLGFGPRDIDESWLPVSDFVEKPVDLDVLCNKVSALLARKRPAAGKAGKETR
jgi:DNA-binding response OmpR family regulator